jgi:spermidine/putrescine transport system permease protein
MEAATADPPVARGRSIPARAWAWLRHNALLIFAGLAVIYMLVPILVIALFSFETGTGQGELDFAWDGFTVDYWKDAFANKDVNDSMVTSLQLAALSTIFSTLIGTLMAMALVRYEFFGRRVTNLLIILPMATPEIVIGAALLSMFVLPPFSDIFDLGFQTLLVAHVMFSISFVVVVVRSRLIGFDRSLEEAAADLGSTPLTTFRTVTLPLLAPGIMAAALLAFALSLDDFVISNLNSGAETTFPLYIFGASLRGIPVQVNVLATMLFFVTVIAILLVLWQQRRAERMAAVAPDEGV